MNGDFPYSNNSRIMNKYRYSCPRTLARSLFQRDKFLGCWSRCVKRISLSVFPGISRLMAKHETEQKIRSLQEVQHRMKQAPCRRARGEVKHTARI